MASIEDPLGTMPDHQPGIPPHVIFAKGKFNLVSRTVFRSLKQHALPRALGKDAMECLPGVSTNAFAMRRNP